MPRRIMKLSGKDWWLGQAAPDAPDQPTWHGLDQVGEWLPATVPGNVRADLVRAGRLPDLIFGMQSEAAQGEDDHCWWLTRRFSLGPSPAERVHLVLRGADYVSDPFLNGQHLGRHEGMFSPQVYDITALLRAENRLAVHITGSRWLPCDRSAPWEKLLNHFETKVSSLSRRFPHRRDTLKCQMGFGWDFAPPLRTMGLWDDVYIVISGDVFIRDVITRQQPTGDDVTLAIQVEMDAQRARRAQLRCTLSGETFDSDPIAVEHPIELVPGTNRRTVELTVTKPRLWWPWDRGHPDLYRLVVDVISEDETLDAADRTVGLRQVEMEGWTLRVNGQRVYARGANWVPADVLPGRVSRADYQELLALARRANMNMVRVWGGGLREKRAFYDLCDRMGILVWQEFPVACAFLARFPRTAAYLRLVEAEASSIIRDLRRHPSIVLWCGGNEFSPRRNASLVATLEQAAAKEDPTRPFVPASPANGDSHNWKVWHHFQPASAYRDDKALFASEFGLQAPPDIETLRRFIPLEELWPPGPSWIHHGAGLNKLWRYARPFLGEQESSAETFVQASQRAQAQALQIAVEHYRRRKASGGGGALIWQLNEPWPAISWALVDFYRQSKPAYETVKRIFQPLLVSLEIPLRHYRVGDEVRSKVWILNDRPEGLADCHVEIVLWDGAGQPVHRFAQMVDVAADSADVVSRFQCTLPAGGGWRLTCSLTHNGRVLTVNEYDLTSHDSIQPTLKQRLRTWLSGLVNPA